MTKKKKKKKEEEEEEKKKGEKACKTERITQRRRLHKHRCTQTHGLIEKPLPRP